MLVSVSDIVSAVTAVVVTAFIGFRWRRRKLYDFAALIDDPPGVLPIVGLVANCFGKSMEEITKWSIELAARMKPIVKLWIGPKLCVVLNDPRDIEITMNSPHCIEKASVYRFFALKNSLFTLSTDSWRSHRKLLNPSFNSKILKSFIPIFNAKARILADQLAEREGKGEFNFIELSGRCTLDMITSTSFGGKHNFQTDIASGKLFLSALHTYMKMVSLRCFNVFHHIDWLYRISINYKKMTEALDFLYELPKAILKGHQKKLENEEKHAARASEEGEEFRKPQIYIDQLLHLSKTQPDIFDEQTIKDEATVLLIGGQETTALTIAQTVLLLAVHPEVQDKVYAELNEVFFDPEEVPDYDTLSKLEYTERVLQETMRLFPAGGLIARETTHEQKLATINVTVPPGVMILYSFFNLHRNPKYWGPDSHLFNPDNFTPENVKKRHPYSYLPFSAGPRNCIGHRYAMLSLKIILVHILRRYKFHTTYTMDTITPLFDITLKMAHPHSVSVERRSN